MAEQLKRWDGSAWVPVAAVNRMVIGGDTTGALLYQPTGYANSIPPGYPFTGADASLSPMSGLGISYTYTLKSADLTTGAIAIASTEYGVNQAKEFAFDDNVTKNWYAIGSVNQWVGVDLGASAAKIVNEVRLLTNPSRLQAFKIQGSDDGTTWTDIYAGAQMNNTDWQTYNFDNHTAYRFYRIFCNGALYDGANVNVTECEMFYLQT